MRDQADDENEPPFVAQGGRYWTGTEWRPAPQDGGRPAGSGRSRWLKLALGAALGVVVVGAGAGGWVLAKSTGSGADGPRDAAGATSRSGSSANEAAPEAADPDVPDAEKPDAADRCVDVIMDGFARRCPDGSLYEVPAAEADLEGEADAGAPPDVQTLEDGFFATTAGGGRVAIVITEAGNTVAVFEAGEVPIELTATDFYIVGMDDVRRDYKESIRHQLAPGERYELRINAKGGAYALNGDRIVYAPYGVAEVIWQISRDNLGGG